MDTEGHLGVHLAGIRFRSPVVASSSEWGAVPAAVEGLCVAGAGGVVTKTFTSKPEYKVRVRPYQFPLGGLGKGFREGKCLYSLAAPHVEPIGPWCRRVSKMSEICQRYSVGLVASFFEEPSDLSGWRETARAMADSGACLLELNFSCPHVGRVFEADFTVAGRILEAVKSSAQRVPIGVKIGPMLEPLEEAAQCLERSGADFITAHNAPGGLVIDVEAEEPFGAPAIGGYAMGRAFLPFSLARAVRLLRASSLPVIGVGGVSGHSDVLQYLLAGCRLVGVGSGLYFEGPGLFERINSGLEEWMEVRGYRAPDEFMGKVLPLVCDAGTLAAREAFPYALPPEGPYLPAADPESCSGCGACTRVCVYGALRVDEEFGRVVADPGLCWSCGFCVGVCPEGALSLKDRRDPKRLIWDGHGTASPFKNNREKKGPSG